MKECRDCGKKIGKSFNNFYCYKCAVDRASRQQFNPKCPTMTIRGDRK